MANERELACAIIYQAVQDAQSKTPGVAHPARLWLLAGADGLLDALDVYHGVIRFVGSLEPLPQMAFYEMAWDGWQPEPVMMGCSTPEVAELEPEEPEEPEPDPAPMSYTDGMVARVCGWAVQGELGR